MGTISLKNAGVTATTPLFNNLNLTVGANDRMGLIASNGGGKTTLLRCIAGLGELSQGDITCSRGLRIGLVEQHIADNLLNMSLREAVLDALPEADRETEGWRADVALDGFDTPYELRDRQVRALSGGWQRLALIARVWVLEPDALLLDEPTNHLDLGKIYQLEDWLNNHVRGIPVIIASHDRDFLDATTNRTLFLRPEESQIFTLPFSKAREALEEVDAAASRKQEKELKEAQHLRRNAAKLTNIGINSGSDLLTVKAKQLKQRASKIEENAQNLHKERSGEIKLANRGTHAKVLLAVEDVPVTTPAGEVLFTCNKLLVFQGERIVLLGRNGTGKSQFVKLLHRAMQTPDSIKGIRVTPSVVLGYVDQDMSQLNEKATPSEIISMFHLGDARARALLASAGFPVEKHNRPITELSYGQRARLGMLELRLKDPNFYLMDEPTNHIDIPAQERLEEEILLHEATCILVSHDRRLVRNIGTRYLLIEGKKLKEVESPEVFFDEMSGRP